MKRYESPPDILNAFEMQQVYNFFSVKNGEELAEYLGDGRLRLPEVIHRLKYEFGLESLKPVAAGEELNNVVLTTLDPVSIKLSSCCKPLPTEKYNMALLTRERLSVHRKNCPRLKEIKYHREDSINVSWNLRSTTIKKSQTIHILEAKRQRLLMIAGVAPRSMQIDELTMLSSAPTKTPAWQLIFKVPNLAVLRDVLSHFEKSSIQFEFEFDY